MFQDGRAEEAMKFYVGLVEGSSIQTCSLHEDGEQVGKLKMGEFTLGTQAQFIIFDSPVKHAFQFTPSISIFIDCVSQEEQDKLYSALAVGGAEMMPLNNYGFSQRFGWLADKYGVSWQINLP